MVTKKNTQGMQRRNFLKVVGAGLASVWMLSASSAPLTKWFLAPYPAAQTTFGTSVLRGTQIGQIFQSLDQGRTWQALISFGTHCAVQNLSIKNGLLYARLVVSGYPFWLWSADGKTWRTLS